MLSFLSFLTGRKKSKRASWAGPSGQPDCTANAVNPDAASSAVKRQTSRFLSLRSQPSGRQLGAPPNDETARESPHPQGKDKAASNGTLPPLPAWDLALGDIGHFNAAGDLVVPGPSLGLEDYGQIPRLTPKELKQLRKVKLDVDQVRECWQLFGSHLKQTGCEDSGLMLPNHNKPNPALVNYLFAMFLLQQGENMAPLLPTIHLRIVHIQPRSLYSELLDTLLVDSPSAHDLCQVLVFSLKRLKPDQLAVIDSAMYFKFVQDECAASYPLDAYTSLFLPRLPQDVGAYLDTIFDVFAVIASKSDVNLVLGGKLCLVYGSMIWGSWRTMHGHWEEVYGDWQTCGKRVEHLFYAWIRSQSLKSTLPTRLLDLIRDYPYGPSTPTSQVFPSPPPSTIIRRTLHVDLWSEIVPSRDPTPAELLQAALAASPSDTVPYFAALQDRYSHPQDSIKEDLLAVDSRAFLQRFPLDPVVDPATATASGQVTIIPTRDNANDKTSLGHGGSQNTLDQAHTAKAPLDETLSGPTSWDHFSQCGFADTVQPRGLAISSPRPGTESTLPSVDEMPSRPTSPPLELHFKRERVLELDDAFLPFVEATQLNNPGSILSNICLVRLSDTGGSVADPGFDWLLLSVYQKSRQEETATMQRAPSPDRESTVSRRRSKLGTLASTIRRSVSGTFRGQNGKGDRANGPSPNGLDSVEEEDLAGYSVSPDPGLTTAQPQLANGATQAAIGTQQSEGQAAPAIVLHPPVDAIDDTPASDWHYIAEGGANIVFGYHGSDPSFISKALRIRKTMTAMNDGEDELAEKWREDLLPRLLPPRLLPSTKVAQVKVPWINQLLAGAASQRPVTRFREYGNSLPGHVNTMRAEFMDDLRAAPKRPAHKVLAVEIKPKWGFLPAAENIVPDEAKAIKSTISRYTLHQHLRGKPNDYEPLDLYSGQADRMEKAIGALWRLWHESTGDSNNWRVFVDGKLVTPDQSHVIPGVKDGGDAVARTMPLLLPILRQTLVLDHIRMRQSQLDPRDISHLAQRFAEHYPQRDIFDPDMMPEYSSDIIEQIIESCIAKEGQNSPQWSLTQSIVAYALSATFKDCSVFLTCPLVPDGNGWKAVTSECTAKVIDLDLKPTKNMRKWYELDEKIWRHWHNTHLAPSITVTTATERADSPALPQTNGSAGKPDQLNSIPPHPSSALTSKEVSSGLQSSSTRGTFERTPGGSTNGTPVEQTDHLLSPETAQRAQHHQQTLKLLYGDRAANTAASNGVPVTPPVRRGPPNRRASTGSPDTPDTVIETPIDM